MSPSRREGTNAPRAALLMRVLLTAMGRRTAGELARSGFGDLGTLELRIIEQLYLAPRRASYLADVTAVSKQAVNQVLDRMESNGYATRVPDRDDGRAKLVTLSSKGRRAAGAALSVAEANDHRWKQLLGEAKFIQLRGALQELIVAEKRLGES